MAPRRSPFNSKKAIKQVSFGDDTVKQVERIPLQEHAAVWYSRRQMSMFHQSRSFKEAMGAECSEESYIHAQKHVKRITTTCRTQLELSDGYWVPKMARELSKMSLVGSMGHVDAARGRAKIVHKEVYDTDVIYQNFRSLPLMSTRGGKGKQSSTSRAQQKKDRVRSNSPFGRIMNKLLPICNWGSPLKKTNLERQTTEDSVLTNALSLSSSSASGDQAPVMPKRTAPSSVMTQSVSTDC